MPNINGGPQDDPRWKEEPAKGFHKIPAPEKRDFENLDTRLYLALKKLIQDWVGISEDAGNRNASEDPDFIAAQKVMRDFEDSHGPMPEWAAGRNFGLEYVVGTQLYTRNGRRSGNGWLVKVTTEQSLENADRTNPYGEWTAYHVITDAGSCIMNMNRIELEEMFWAGDWICTTERILRDFDRMGHFSG